MWEKIGRLVLQYRVLLLILLFAATGFMAYQASRVQLSYEFAKAIPVDNPRYQTYLQFKEKFGEDGNLLVIGLDTRNFFTPGFFNEYRKLAEDLDQIRSVEDVIGVHSAVNLYKDSTAERLQAKPIFSAGDLDQAGLDSARAQFASLPFYRGLLYNPETNAYLLGVRINKSTMTSPDRTRVVREITARSDAFAKKQGIEVHYSGLPLIRTQLADRIAKEMKYLLLGSLLLSAVILLIFFKSVSNMVLSLVVVLMGVIWSFGTMHLLGYKITLLNALIPPLIVVIGIPNCIYFLNKFHVSWNQLGDKRAAIVHMVGKMGIVTLFCNIAAAIGFAVFALTKSAILKEFGAVAGINIMVIFLISFILIPVVLSYLPPPKDRHTRYLDNPRLQRWLVRLERWSLQHRPLVYSITIVVCLLSVAGLTRIKSEGYIVDDLPKTDKIYTDLKYFEHHFGGVMPLEIVVDTKRKNGMRSNPLQTFEKIDALSQYLDANPAMARPLSLVEGLKFARQAYYDGDSAAYGLPNSFDISFLAGYLNSKADTSASGSNFAKLISGFMDKEKQQARISVNMKDVGSARLPLLLDSIQQEANRIFDTSKYQVSLTGSSVTFQEGTTFLINGLKESIVWAFLLISLCMLYLFKSLRILICSLIPNLVPLLITAGVMGWVGVPLKPSTVLIFSVALGIAIDITIRFLVNYKQESVTNPQASTETLVVETIHSTGISIVYTALVLVAGFVIFCFSGFGGTQSLGWLTSLTLIVATVTNLVLLPALLISVLGTKRKK
jgi:predicted RND superfamily exporter protein